MPFMWNRIECCLVIQPNGKRISSFLSDFRHYCFAHQQLFSAAPYYLFTCSLFWCNDINLAAMTSKISMISNDQQCISYKPSLDKLLVYNFWHFQCSRFLRYVLFLLQLTHLGGSLYHRRCFGKAQSICLCRNQAF